LKSTKTQGSKLTPISFLIFAKIIQTYSSGQLVFHIKPNGKNTAFGIDGNLMCFSGRARVEEQPLSILPPEHPAVGGRLASTLDWGKAVLGAPPPQAYGSR
jgi:hypothetical protein